MNRYQQRRAKGLCGWSGCDVVTGPDQALCDAHREPYRLREARKAKAAAKTGACSKCGRPTRLPPWCRRCRQEHIATQKRRRDADHPPRQYRCGICGGLRHDRRNCPDRETP